MRALPAGVYTIMPTPFTKTGELDVTSLRTLVEFQISAGVHGLAILGFMGESHKLTTDERRTVLQTVVEQARGRVPVVVGVRAFGTMGAIEQAREAEAHGAAGVFVAPLGVQEEGAQFQHYEAIGRAVGIPVVIHDFPEEFGIRLSPQLLARLAKETEGVRYVKLEEPPIGIKVTRIRELSDGAMQVFGGLGGIYFLEELERGAVGTMTGFAFPEILVAIFTHFHAGRHDRAAEVFDRYCTVLRYEFQPKIGLAIRKRIYQERGAISSDYVRPPAAVLDDITAAELQRVVQRAGLSFAPAGQLALG